MKQGRISLLVGLAFLFLCFGVIELVAPPTTTAWPGFLKEGLTIAGWVAIVEAARNLSLRLVAFTPSWAGFCEAQPKCPLKCEEMTTPQESLQREIDRGFAQHDRSFIQSVAHDYSGTGGRHKM
jgi:hypothetical protein